MESLLILLALMFTFSTGSWIALLVGVVAFSFLVGRTRYRVLLLLLILALAVLVFTVFPSQIGAQLAHAGSSTTADHLGTWETAAGVIKAYPLSGVGLGDQAFLIRSNPYLSPAQTVPQAEPDNSYLQWGAISGIPVMLVFLLLLANVFWFALQNWLIINPRYRSLLGGGDSRSRCTQREQFGYQWMD